MDHAQPDWATAAAGQTSRTLPAELQALGDHLAHCRARSGRWFALQCGGEAVHGFLASRLVTTLLFALLLVVAGSVLIG